MIQEYVLVMEFATEKTNVIVRMKKSQHRIARYTRALTKKQVIPRHALGSETMVATVIPIDGGHSVKILEQEIRITKSYFLLFSPLLLQFCFFL